MKQLRYLMVLMTAGALLWLSQVLFNFGLHEKDSRIGLLVWIALVLYLIFLVKFGGRRRSPNA